MYSELFWAWLRKGYLAVLIGDVFIPVPLWMIAVAVMAMAFVVAFVLSAMSTKRREKNSSG